MIDTWTTVIAHAKLEIYVTKVWMSKNTETWPVQAEGTFTIKRAVRVSLLNMYTYTTCTFTCHLSQSPFIYLCSARHLQRSSLMGSLWPDQSLSSRRPTTFTVNRKCRGHCKTVCIMVWSAKFHATLSPIEDSTVTIPSRVLSWISYIQNSARQDVQYDFSSLISSNSSSPTTSWDFSPGFLAWEPSKPGRLYWILIQSKIACTE